MLDKHLRRIYKPFYRFIWNRKNHRSKSLPNSLQDLDLKVPDQRNEFQNNDDKIKHIGLRILRCLQVLSVKHEFQFCLAYGTLLGAIRHNGFIPWDDDIDIFMTSADLEKFIEVSAELPEHLKVITMDVEFFKVMDRSSIISKDGERGVAVDIFLVKNYGADQMYFYNVHKLKKLIFPSVKLFPFKQHKFEQYEFPIPAQPEYLLEELYGDYMALPPIEERISHHSDPEGIRINNYGNYLN